MTSSQPVKSPRDDDLVDFTKINLDDTLKKLDTTADGLSTDEANHRLQQYGPNALPDKEVNPILEFLSYFWGPIPWMIEIAAVLSIIVQHWPDLIIILVLLSFNAVVGFWQERQAANAVDALKKQLALKAKVKRDRQWTEVDAANLVPGDIIRLRLGDIIPADVKLAEGDYLSVDQSALTGESLPVEKKSGDVGLLRFGGQAGRNGRGGHGDRRSDLLRQDRQLVSEAQSVSHFQSAVLTSATT